MALVTLSNGKVIDVDLLWYLSLSDAEYQELIAMDSGFEVENPFHGSVLSKRPPVEEDDETEDLKPLDQLDDSDLEIPERDDV